MMQLPPIRNLLPGFAVLLAQLAVADDIAQPAGLIPVLHEVDVVVVGGGSGGVGAAVEAAKAGANVFLAAPRPYLGEDLCATYRLWLEPGETPSTELAREVFKPGPPPPAPIGPGLPFKYSASQPSAERHPDTKPESLLNDRDWQSASRQSVQYDSDVALMLDLGSEQEIGRVHLMAYQRPGQFEVARVMVSVGSDGQNWSPAGVITNTKAGDGTFEWNALILSGEIRAKARCLKLQVQRSPEAGRLLLGEIVVEGPAAGKPAAGPQQTAAFVTPMQVKRTLDQALIKAKVPFLYWCYATELLRDAAGKPAGVIISTRSGRQAVVAKVIIDATERANVARIAGAAFTEYPAGLQKFTRIVVGGAPREGKGLRVRQSATPLAITDQKGEVFPVHEYEIQVPMRGAAFGAFAEAEQLARDLTWSPKAVDSSEVLFQVPPDHFRGQGSFAGRWPGAEKVPLECLQPKKEERIYVLGGCADVSRETAAALLRPVNQMALGARIGQAAAALAARTPKLEGIRVAGKASTSTRRGVIREVAIEQNHRAEGTRLTESTYGVPVLGEYDVVVVGGGTGGAPAGIAAGRQGARTLLIEYLHGLGGVGTMGYIAMYYHGNCVGFSTEVSKGVAAYGDTTREKRWNPEHKSEWYRSELRKAGVDIWCGVLGQGVVMDGQKVIGVVVLTPQGRGIVLAKTVVDSTGNADIAAAAGAICRYTDDTDVAVQGAGLPPRDLGQKYVNTDYTFVDDTDIFDVWRVLVTARMKFQDAYDLGQLVDTRERRQILGDFFFSPMDMVLQRTFPDTIVIARSNFDSHGYIIHPLFMIRPPHRDDIDVRVPWRCLLPRGLDGVIVTGLGVSAHRDALPCIRMQPDVENQGYAAGVAAAWTAKKGGATRALDIKELQKHLVAVGNLPESILRETDNFPLPQERVAEAVRRVANDYDGLEIVLAQFDIAQPLLRQALATAPEKDRLVYAHILGMMGDGAGAQVLADAVRARQWDKGWRYTGMGQFGPCMSPLDSHLIALGRTRSLAGLKPILEKASQLDANSEFSHFRAVAMALEALADKSAAQPLAKLLRKPGLGGHAVTTIDTALEEANPPTRTDTSIRNQALKELYLARALFRCGDYEGLGAETLREYSRDLHGHYARHAKAVLKTATGPVE
ncbi:MAG TPA: FAD-dependent oxidoreductase [Candidatus Paceibacterota bacterium]|nr:FAD-dependent oxidoreductase [Verrucomicrobiota bacterium]HSA11494.1 FAD-dependent oxidoreductase [Candidatus Paceibacterota bacterium]